MEDLFHESASIGTLINFIKYFAGYYTATEQCSLQRLLASPFVHADETPINIQGVDHYVWVFTNGKHVVFRMTETREAAIVHEFLSGYKGVLISDFYGATMPSPVDNKSVWCTSSETSTMTFGMIHTTETMRHLSVK